jgi:hypothetical protein
MLTDLDSQEELAFIGIWRTLLGCENSSSQVLSGRYPANHQAVPWPESTLLESQDMYSSLRSPTQRTKQDPVKAGEIGPAPSPPGGGEEECI